MATTVELHELNREYILDPDTLFLISKGGTEYNFAYEDMINRVEQDLKDNSRNFNWNAKYFDDIPINSNSTSQHKVMMYQNNENAYVSTTIVPDHLDWSDSVTDQRWLRLDSSGEITSDDVYVADILPSSNYSDYSNRFLILRVSNDGEYIYEYELDTSDFITQPQDNVDDLNDVVGNHYKVGNITQNRPNTDDGYLINLKSDDYDSQSQLFLSTDSNKIRYRRHDGTQFQSWITVYNDSENPLSDSVSNNSSIHIATSKAVKTVKDDLTALDNSLTPQYLLDQVRQVDGDGSDLNADKMHDISGDEYATMFDNTPINKLPEQAIRFNHNSRIFEEKSSGLWQNLSIDGDGIITAEVGSKGTVAFADVQEARDAENGVATSPESVHTILQKYGISNDQDPGEEVADADITFTTGFYRLPSSATGNPFTNSASLIVYRPGINNWVHQIVIKGDSTETNVRYYDGSTWSSWGEYFNTEISGTTGINVLKSETQDEGRLALGMDVGVTGFDLIESETISDARNALNISQTDTVNFGNVTINGNDVYHEGNMSITDNRTSTAIDEVINAKGMNDHINSGDHDDRYYTQAEVDQLIAEATGTPSGGIIMWSGTIGNIPTGWALCVTGDTLVALEDGSKREIQEIVENKQQVNVLSYNEYNGKVESKPVVDWFDNEVHDRNIWHEIKFSSSNKEGHRTLDVTQYHPIWVIGKGWTKACEVNEDDFVLKYENDNNDLDQIEAKLYKFKVLHNRKVNSYHNSKKNRSKYKKRYDIKVKDNHSFIANDIIVHNCDGSNGTPDLRNRFVIGAGDMYSENNTGGSKDAVVVQHSHGGTTYNDGIHSHDGETDNYGLHAHEYRDRFHSEIYHDNQSIGEDIHREYIGHEVLGSNSTDADNEYFYYIDKFTDFRGQHSHEFTTNNDGNHSHNLDIDSAGEDGTDKNLPPYYALAYIMKL